MIFRQILVWPLTVILYLLSIAAGAIWYPPSACWAMFQLLRGRTWHEAWQVWFAPFYAWAHVTEALTDWAGITYSAD